MMDYITVKIPRDHWEQIVSDIENMCARRSTEIEILADAWVVEDER